PGRLFTKILGCGFVGHGSALQRGASASGIGAARLAGSVVRVDRLEEGGETGGNDMLAGHLLQF
ncbi:hypothetical protein, partial [Pseudomonas aeruginosa]|uniref:hypothetical protein n=1 Tax=Pseudomonas aeruginosa TaxID=287 RepID=UPI003F7DEEDD